MEKTLTLRFRPKELEMIDYLRSKYWEKGYIARGSRSELIRFLIGFFHDRFRVVKDMKREIKERIEKRDEKTLKRIEYLRKIGLIA